MDKELFNKLTQLDKIEYKLRESHGDLGLWAMLFALVFLVGYYVNHYKFWLVAAILCFLFKFIVSGIEHSQDKKLDKEFINRLLDEKVKRK